MNLVKALTPKDTEEIKPNLFVQRRGNDYRVVYPLAWNGKLRVKEQIKTVISLRTIFTIGLILFICWSYVHDVKEYREFYVEVTNNTNQYCQNYYNNIQLPDGGIGVIHENTYNIQMGG